MNLPPKMLSGYRVLDITQFVAGPAVLFTLPAGGITAPMLAVLAPGVLFGALAIFALADTLRGRDRLRRAALLLIVTVLCMGTVRHLIRESLLQRPLEGWNAAPSRASVVNVTHY